MSKLSQKSNVTNEATVLIIGGGIAGLAAANALHGLGISPFILEKAPFLGGHGIQFACKATESCQRCSACAVEEALKRVTGNPLITVALRSELKSFTKENGRFATIIEQKPLLIDTEKCNNCGECYKICPAAGNGAIQQAYSIFERLSPNGRGAGDGEQNANYRG